MLCATIQFYTLYKACAEIDPRRDDDKLRPAYFLPRHQQVLVHVGAQEARVAVTFHQLVDVILSGER